jgi:NitT/TauT family transport system ATP-binding protein
MSARPGRVLRDIPIPIARPRSLDTIIAHPAYGEIAREIRGLLNAEGGVD